jgi:RNA polymerase sigma-70 factor (sigma-E family)
MAHWHAPDDFTEFVRHRHVGLLRFAHVLTGERHVAEDLVQDAFERAGTSWARITRKEDPEGYLRRIIVNRYLNRMRSLRRERLVADAPETGYVDREPTDDYAWRLLAELPRQQRAVLVLRFYLDLSDAQIADILACSVGTVKSNASRAMAKLRTSLAQNSPVKGEAR